MATQITLFFLYMYTVIFKSNLKFSFKESNEESHMIAHERDHLNEWELQNIHIDSIADDANLEIDEQVITEKERFDFPDDERFEGKKNS